MVRSTLVYTLDVLTDGSESTHASLFLSVWKESSNVADYAAAAPIARYSVTGLGDLTSRLASDQRFKLPSKAVFCSTEKGLWGLPSMLIALYQSGAPSLTVVVGSEALEQKVHKIVHLLEANRSHPLVRTCHVPQQQHSNNKQWWQVYQDEYILVHAQKQQNDDDDDDGAVVVFCYTLCRHSQGSNQSIVILPPSCASLSSSSSYYCHDSMDVSSLPLLHTGQPASLLLGIAINPHESLRQRIIHASSLSNCWRYTRSNSSSSSKDQELDSNLLLRAQQQSRLWNTKDPRHFPWLLSSSSACPNQVPVAHDENQLRTGSSLVLPHRTHQPVVVLDRVLQWNEPYDTLSSQSVVERANWPSRYQYELDDAGGMQHDDNEIDLDDDDDKETSADETRSPPTVDLLCLGTGCAAPSPYRGASAYAILLPDDNTFVFECGEGFVTQWGRYANRDLETIKVIWISHAHWDHYGGLVSLLSVLHDRRYSDKTSTNTKRRRLEHSSSLPWVLATKKVLEYLDCNFEQPLQYYRSINLSVQSASEVDAFRDLNKTRPVINHFESVKVDHSCKDAFGFILCLNQNRDKVFTFCFSGDTRPSRRFADTSLRVASERGPVIDVLLHEATYDDDEQQMSKRKKHSTVGEALEIAAFIRARKIVLTHFSQRYDSPPAQESPLRQKWIPTFDGLRLPLYKDGLKQHINC